MRLARILGLVGAMALVAAVFLPATRFSHAYPLILVDHGSNASLFHYAVRDVDRVLGLPPPRTGSDLDPEALKDFVEKVAVAFLPLGGIGECVLLILLGLTAVVLTWTGSGTWLWILTVPALGGSALVLSHYWNALVPVLENMPGGVEAHPLSRFVAPWAWMAIGLGSLNFGLASALLTREGRRGRTAARAFD